MQAFGRQNLDTIFWQIQENDSINCGMMESLPEKARGMTMH
jgi:hypothetical protein